jgi:F0F1-type ATP synthase assembly protein I
MAGDQSPQKRPTPQSGANAGWTAVGYLIAGIGVWGGIGWLVDNWLDVPMHFGTLIGMLVGMAGAVYLIVKNMGT